MAFTCKNIKTVALCLIGMMITGAWLVPVCLAAGYGTGKTNVTIRQIKPLEVSDSDANIRPQDVFDVVGTLNAIDGNRITIGDRRLTLAPRVSASGIAKWAEVGVKLNTAGEVTVIEIVSDEPH